MIDLDSFALTQEERISFAINLNKRYSPSPDSGYWVNVSVTDNFFTEDKITSRNWKFVPKGNYEFGFIDDNPKYPYKLITRKYLEKLKDDEEWFMLTPKIYFKKYKGIDISDEMSSTIQNLTEKSWIDFVWAVNEFDGYDLEEILRITITTIASYCNEKKIPLIDAVKNLKSILRIVIKEPVTYVEKKNILFDILILNKTYAQAKKDNIFEEVDSSAIEVKLREIIAANMAQWEKAKASPNLYNWFVGQYMKSTIEKTDASKVKEAIEKLKSEI